MFFLAKRLFGPLIGVAAAIAFAVLSVGRTVQGTSANGEHFVILFALGGIVLLVNTLDYRKWWSLRGAAVLLGLAFRGKVR